MNPALVPAGETLPCEPIILPAHSTEYAAVRALIIQGLTQRWGKYDASFNPDLEHFADSYQHAVVLVAKIDDLTIGCGALLKETDTVGRIVRMTVRADHQRAGVGRKLLAALLAAAAVARYRKVLLETTSTWQSAVAFYTACGFVPDKVENGDQHFCWVIDSLPPAPP